MKKWVPVHVYRQLAVQTYNEYSRHASRRGLRSSCSDCLVQPPVHRSTVGSRAFSVAGPRVWNYLPPEVTSAPSLKTHY